MVNVKGGIINPNATNSLVIFLLGSIVAGFAAGLGWGLASKMIESTNQQVTEVYRAKRNANSARAVAYAYGSRRPRPHFNFHLA